MFYGFQTSAINCISVRVFSCTEEIPIYTEKHTGIAVIYSSLKV